MSSTTTVATAPGSKEIKAYVAESATSGLHPGHIHRRALRDNDVSVKVLYCGICHTDLHFLKNEWGFTQYPFVPGHEIVGVVEEVGSKVTKFKVGQNVGLGCIHSSCQHCTYCEHNEEQYCSEYTMAYNYKDHISGGVTYGGYSERVVIEDKYVLRLPDGLKLEEVAPLLCAGITTYTPLVEAGIGPGKTVGVFGIGGLGHIAIKLAKGLGAKVYGFTSKAAKIDEIKSLGADDALVTSEESIKAHANTFDLIIDTISGSRNIGSLMSTLKIHGIYHFVGASQEPISIQGTPMLMRGLTLRSSLIGGIKRTQEMLDLCGEKKIGAIVEVVPLKDVNTVMERLEKGDVRYRFVLDVQSAFQ